MSDVHPSPTTAPPPTAFRATFLILCVAAASMAALLALLPAAGHDQLWFLLMAQRWMDGATLYGPQVFDSNPPAIVWASALPVSIARLLHLPASLPAKLLVSLLLAASAWLSFRILRRANSLLARHALALGFAFLCLYAVLPARDFGQRDHLLAVLILPYVLGTGLPAASLSRSNRTVAGLFAALGVCLKPQYALIPLLLELFFLLRPPQPRRLAQLRRPEPWCLLAVGFAYLLAIRVAAPLYFSEALPILRDTYWAVGHLSIPALAGEALQLCLLAVTAIFLYFIAGPRSAAQRSLLLAGLAALAAYFQQGTGWYYQQIPALTLFGSALALQLLDLGQRRGPTLPRWTPWPVAALALLAVGLTTHFTHYPFTADRAFAIDTPDPQLFASLPAGTSVAMLTTSVDATMMPVERYHLTWAQRTNNLWLLPAILRSETPDAGTPPARILPAARLQTLEDLQHRWMVEDLERWQPRMVLVERCQHPKVHCQLLEDRDDDLLAWFLTDPAFARIWAHYRFTKSAGRFDEYLRLP